MKAKIIVPGIWLAVSVEFDEESKTFYLDGYCRYCEDDRVRFYEDEYGKHLQCLDCRQAETLQISYEE